MFNEESFSQKFVEVFKLQLEFNIQKIVSNSKVNMAFLFSWGSNPDACPIPAYSQRIYLNFNKCRRVSLYKLHDLFLHLLERFCVNNSAEKKRQVFGVLSRGCHNTLFQHIETSKSVSPPSPVIQGYKWYKGFQGPQDMRLWAVFSNKQRLHQMK